MTSTIRTRTLAAALAAGACLGILPGAVTAARAAGPAQTASVADARKAIEAQYAAFAAGVGKQSVDAIAAVMTPDFKLVSDGEAVSLADYKAMMKQGFAATEGLTAKVEVTGFTLKGGKAVAENRQTHTGSATVPDGKGGTVKRAVVTVMTFRDHWVKTPKGWRLQKSEGLTSKSTVTPG